MPSLSVQLSGLSRGTGIRERVTVLARQLPDEHVLYMLLVSPAKDFAMMAPAADRMMRSLVVSGLAPHR